ncbi:MAG TPA: FGGY family carbohydrate kinase [Solirubrobacteraceae bacterium]|nr:FGGY family carbohydrate kinase [Solirubrobacteraceae bacterium]
MPAPDHVLAIDQGTSGTKAVLVDSSGAIVARAGAPVALGTPRPGWVEQDAREIWASVRAAVAACLEGRDAARVAAAGLSTQRESLVLWDRATGEPLGPMLSWQDQRTVDDAARLRDHGEQVLAVSGLPLDPMFSALKARWLLDHHGRRNVCLGTVDSFLLWRLGGGHVIEAGNAARTQLLDVREGAWSPALLELFGVPEAVLPEVVPSTGPFPAVRDLPPLRDGTPVCAVMGDSHAALFAHAGWRPGQVKATYGTGSSIMSLGDPAAWTPGGLCLTIAWDDGGGPAHAFEGNIRSSGATLTWLAGLFGTTPAALAGEAAASSDGVHLVPAFGGLGAPWWDDRAVGLISGLTFATRRPHVARAALESIAFQVEDTVAAIEALTGPVQTLLADGGPTANRTLMQLQADTGGRVVARSLAAELSALGAAHLAGRAAGVWSPDDLEALDRPRERYDPAEPRDSRHARVAAWHAALARARLQEETAHAAL